MKQVGEMGKEVFWEIVTQPFQGGLNRIDFSAIEPSESLIVCRVCSRPQANLAMLQNSLLWPERTVSVKPEACLGSETR